MRRIGLLLLGLLGAAPACSGQDEAVGDPGRRGDACSDYQDALCDWVLECTSGVGDDDGQGARFKRQQCEASASAIVCAQDGRAERCTDAIDVANCRTPPDDCELFDVADRAPALEACQQYGDAICQARVGCGTQTLAECQSELQTLDCATIVGVKSGFGACLAALAEPDCTQIPPDACNDVLLGEPTVAM